MTKQRTTCADKKIFFLCTEITLLERWKLLEKQNKNFHLIPLQLDKNLTLSNILESDYIIGFTKEEINLLKEKKIPNIIDNLILHNYNIKRYLEYEEVGNKIQNISFVSNVCAAAYGYKWLNIPFNGPFVWGYMRIKSYIKVLNNFSNFIGDVFEITDNNYKNEYFFDDKKDVPVGKNENIQYYFNHYKNIKYETIKKRHISRSKRFNYDKNIIITVLETVQEIEELLKANPNLEHNHLIITPCIYPNKNVISFPFWQKHVENEVDRKAFYRFYTRYFTEFFNFDKFCLDIFNNRFQFKEYYLTNKYYTTLHKIYNKNIQVDIERQKNFIIITSKTINYKSRNSNMITSVNLFASHPAIHFLRYDNTKYIDIFFKDGTYKELSGKKGTYLIRENLDFKTKAQIQDPFIIDSKLDTTLANYLTPNKIGNEVKKDFQLKYEYVDNNSERCIVIFNDKLSNSSKSNGIETFSYYNLSNQYLNYNYLYISDNYGSYQLLDNFYFKDILYNKIIFNEITSKIDDLLETINCKEFFAMGSSKGGFGALIHGIKCKKISKIFSAIPIFDIEEYNIINNVYNFNNINFDENNIEKLIKETNKEILFYTNLFDYPHKNYTISKRLLKKYTNVHFAYSYLGTNHSSIILDNYEEMKKILFNFFERKLISTDNIKVFNKKTYTKLLILEYLEYIKSTR